MTGGIALPVNEYIVNSESGASYMTGKSPADYPCYRKTTFVLPSSIVESVIHQIIFHGPSEFGKESGWIVNLTAQKDYLSEFISMQTFERSLLKLRDRSEEQYMLLSRWIEITRMLLKQSKYGPIVSETLTKTGVLKDDEIQTVRQLYFTHHFFPLYLNSAKSIVFFIFNRLLTDIIHDAAQDKGSKWPNIIERGFELE
jgi:hypothetical protein